MAQINLVTGHTGQAHIKSEDDARLNSFIAGTDGIMNSILPPTFSDTSVSLNYDFLVDGRLIRTDGAVTLNFSKPASGYYRYDGIYVNYLKDINGIESAEIVYCEGEQNVAQATAAENIGQPTFDASIVSHKTLQLFTVVWGNNQTRINVIYNAPVLNQRFILDEFEFVDALSASIMAEPDMIIANGMVFLNLYLEGNSAPISVGTYTVNKSYPILPNGADTYIGVTKKGGRYELNYTNGVWTLKVLSEIPFADIGVAKLRWVIGGNY